MRIRKIIILAVSVAGATLVVLFFFALKKHYSEAAEIGHIPSAELVTVTGERFILDESVNGKKTALLFFSPECEYCRKEIEGIIGNRSLFEGSVWVFVTISSTEELSAFMIEYPLGEIPDSKICVDENLELFETLNVTAPPSLFVYDSAGKLEHHNRGAVSIKTIIEWMK